MSLPSASSTSLVFAQATPEEQQYCWTLHHPSWGPQYTQEAYIARERHLLACDLVKDGGLTCWILTDPNCADAAGAPGSRPVLCTCETYRKRALVRGADGLVRDVTAYGIASVWTPKDLRKKGYANRMMSMLGDHLAKQQSLNPADGEFSILFSDIGAQFYANHQWMPFRSSYLDIPVKPSSTAADAVAFDNCITLVTDDNVSMVAELDEKTLRKQIAAAPRDPHKVRAALLPDHDVLAWHMERETNMFNYILDRAPTVRGAMYTPPGQPNSRVSATWAGNLYGGKEKPQDNVLVILKFTVEDDAMSDEEMSRAIRAIMGVAQRNAEEFLIAKIEMWNPDERTERLVNQMPDLQAKLVVRETSKIASLRWFGEGTVSDVEWVANEMFEWC